MMNRLIVEGREMDLGDIEVNLNFQINDLGDISTRNSTYSNSINIPRTSRNEAIFGFLGVTGMDSRTPYRKLGCTFIQENIAIINNGYLLISERQKDYYRCTISDGIIDLQEKIKGRTLADLDYSDLNHTLTSSTFLASQSNTAGYIYAVGNFGKPVDPTIQMDSQAPSIFIHTLFDKIFTEAGFTYSGSFFDSQNYRTEVLTVNQGYQIEDLTLTETSIGPGQTNVISRYQNSDSYINYSEDHTIQSNSFNANVSVSGGTITSNYNGRLKIELNTTYSSYETGLYLRTLKNGSIVASSNLPKNQSQKSIVISLDVLTGDQIKFQIQAYSENDSTGQGQDDFQRPFEISFNTSSSIVLKQLSGGQQIKFEEIIGTKIKQLDLLKDVMNRYGLLVRPNGRSKTNYEFYAMENLLNERENAVDYSKQFVEILNDKYQTDYAQINTAQYQYPDTIKEAPLDGNMILDNENLKSNETLFQSSFSISEFDGNYYSIPIWEEKDDSGTILYEPKEITNRIFRLSQISGSKGFRFFDNATVSTVTNAPLLSLNDLEMSYFLATQYQGFKNLMDSYRELDVQMNLGIIDLLKVDFFRLVYLKQTQRFYYFQKVTNQGKANFLEISAYSQNQPVEQLGTYTFTMNYGGSRMVSLIQLTDFSIPKYRDPENDPPLKIKFISYGSNGITIEQDGTPIIDQTEIEVQDLDLMVVDDGTDLNEHQSQIEYQIMDSGSNSYGSQIGIIQVNVAEYVNTAPIANAGTDRTINLGEEIPQTTIFASLVGSASYDNTGSIQSYKWEFQTKPNNSTATITNNQSSPNGTLNLPNQPNSQGTYIMLLTVTDSFGLTDTDTVQFLINYEYINTP